MTEKNKKEQKDIKKKSPLVLPCWLIAIFLAIYVTFPSGHQNQEVSKKLQKIKQSLDNISADVYDLVLEVDNGQRNTNKMLGCLEKQIARSNYLLSGITDFSQIEKIAILDSASRNVNRFLEEWNNKDKPFGYFSQSKKRFITYKDAGVEDDLLLTLQSVINPLTEEGWRPLIFSTAWINFIKKYYPKETIFELIKKDIENEIEWVIEYLSYYFYKDKVAKDPGWIKELKAKEYWWRRQNSYNFVSLLKEQKNKDELLKKIKIEIEKGIDAKIHNEEEVYPRHYIALKTIDKLLEE